MLSGSFKTEKRIPTSNQEKFPPHSMAATTSKIKQAASIGSNRNGKPNGKPKFKPGDKVIITRDFKNGISLLDKKRAHQSRFYPRGAAGVVLKKNPQDNVNGSNRGLLKLQMEDPAGIIYKEKIIMIPVGDVATA